MESMKHTAIKAYNALDNIFTNKEAWDLFRLSAFVETFGWTCLIVGITAVKLQWTYSDAILAVSGSIHGIFYICYIFIVIFAHRSMKWSFWRFLFAGAVSVVPYGALVFERWVAHRRKLGKV
jgi:integral membrane protein